MRRMIVAGIACLSLLVVGSGVGVSAATCKPRGICTACSNCRSCKHCSKDGGTCSVCRTKRTHDHAADHK